MIRHGFSDDWLFSRENEDTRQKINVPHDAMMWEQRDPNSPGGSANAFFPGGVYRYSKMFFAPAQWSEKQVTLEFEGVYKDSEVYINGKLAARHASGYFPFFVPLNDYINYDAENTILLVADNSELPNSRWYTGAGIYRPVWLWIGSRTHIKIEGVKITALSADPAVIRIETEYEGEGFVTAEVIDRGKVVCSGEGNVMELTLPEAKLWSEQSPYLYQCSVKLMRQNICLDETTVTFGVRTLTWNERGFFVNGENVLLRGACVHHDHGILGARCYAKSEERRVRILKNAGFNAIRSSHNPASKSLLEACDRLGMYVIDETWDMWYKHKTAYDYAKDFDACYRQDITSLVRRDYNHPSVIMYSIGNEVTEPAKQRGIDLAGEMVGIFHELDHARPVTCGLNLWLICKSVQEKSVYDQKGDKSKAENKKDMRINSTLFNLITSQVGTKMNNSGKSKKADAQTSPVIDRLDIAGYNYGSGRYPLEGKQHPKRIVVGSETFPQDIAKNWEMVKQYPYLIGDFLWTGWDYLGEVGLGAWSYSPDAAGFNKPYPWLLADTGAFDILGNPTAEVDHAAAVWGLLKNPGLTVQPPTHPEQKLIKMAWRGSNGIASWSWRQCDGNKAVVEVFTAEPMVELFANNNSLGKKKTKECKASYSVPYARGTLCAVSYSADGKETGRTVLQSASGSLNISVQPEDACVAPGEITYINISLTGENGIVESNADRPLTISVRGGTLLAFGSANPRTEESFLQGKYTTYYGHAQAVVCAGGEGGLTVTVSGEGLESADASVTVALPQ